MTLVFRSVRPLIKQRACIRVKQLNVMFSPRNWSVQYTSTSEAEDFKKLTNKDWEKKLSPEQYYVCREKGTEAPFTGKYYNHNEEGVYNCSCCGTDLFSSVSKYDSGTGWPSFYEAVVENNEDNVLKRTDNTQGMTRTEVLCKTCNSHLGHVFDDGPPPSGLRFCVNSLALKFTPKKLKENKK